MPAMSPGRLRHREFTARLQQLDERAESDGGGNLREERSSLGEILVEEFGCEPQPKLAILYYAFGLYRIQSKKGSHSDVRHHRSGDFVSK
jgi:hypothetical protein